MSSLAHVRVLDLSRQLPGPFCSSLLADFGADVLAIAAPDDPYPTSFRRVSCARWRKSRSLVMSGRS